MLIAPGALAAALAAAPATPPPADPQSDVIVAAQKPPATPASHAGTDAATIHATVNAIEVEDTLKYLPSLIVRKRHPGDTQAPLATRSAGVGASARSLIYADGVLLSSLVGNNNTSASPRWGLVSPQEIERIDILYGPFSAAYPGNSIGAVVNITTQMPDRLQASALAGASVQRFDQYGTHATLPVATLGATIGDRFGRFAFFASWNHVAADNQPISYVTVAAPIAGTSGGYADLGRTGAAIQVIGASGTEHQIQDHAKLKAAIDLTARARLTYTGALFLNTTDATTATYLRGATGPAYTAAFSSGVYHYAERHWTQALQLDGGSTRLSYRLIGTLYDFAHDDQRMPSGTLPAAASGGAGNDTRLDGTGWTTLDGKLVVRSAAAGANTLSLGAHYDQVRLKSNRYTIADNWLTGAPGALNQQSLGHTRTAALWAEDALRLAAPLTLTLGGRYEWWRAFDGVNYAASPVVPLTRQPVVSAATFSPKASLAFTPAGGWTLRGAFGQAWRFPTVGELYQVVTTPVAAVPNADLKPERALSEELALEHRDAHGTARVSLFNESIRDALLSQLGTTTAITGATIAATFVQNVDRTRARGVEVALDRRDLVPRVDVSGSATYVDATVRADAAFPAAVGKQIVQVPRWKATLVGTWRPVDGMALTLAGRYASRSFGTIDNSDPVHHSYTGFDGYFVADARAVFDIGRHYSLAVGIDNLNNDRYFLFHPFTQRTFHAEVSWKL